MTTDIAVPFKVMDQETRRVVYLEEISDFITKGTTPTTYGFEWVHEGVPFLRSECVSEDGFTTSGLCYVSEEAHQSFSRSVVHGDDLLITITGNVGRVAKYPTTLPEGNINQHIARVRIADADSANSDYVLYTLKSRDYRRYFESIVTGLAYPQLSLKQIRNTPVSLPPLPEQKKIAEVLSSVDEAIAATKAVIDQTKQVKKGLLQTLLTKGIGHTKFKQTELGEIPESWEVVDVGSLADVIDPQPDHRTPPVFEGGVPYVGMGDIDKNGIIDFENAREVHPDVLVKQKAGFDIHPKAFIFGKIGTIGNPTYLPNVERFCLSANVILITSKCPIYSDFLFHALQSKNIESQIFKQINTTSQPALGIKKVRLFKIARPSDLDEMKAITDTLGDFDHAINSNKEKLEQLQTLKYGLMSDLLTGRKRVER